MKAGKTSSPTAWDILALGAAAMLVLLGIGGCCCLVQLADNMDRESRTKMEVRK